MMMFYSEVLYYGLSDGRSYIEGCFSTAESSLLFVIDRVYYHLCVEVSYCGLSDERPHIVGYCSTTDDLLPLLLIGCIICSL